MNNSETSKKRSVRDREIDIETRESTLKRDQSIFATESAVLDERIRNYQEKVSLSKQRTLAKCILLIAKEMLESERESIEKIESFDDFKDN